MPAEAPLHRLSVEDVYRMVEAGVLHEVDRVELIDGVLVDVSPPGSAHSAAVAWLTRHLVLATGEREVRVQDLLLIKGGFVMPDLIVIDPLPRDRHPDTAALVVEVAVSSHRHDGWKAERFAGARVDEYWIVDLPGRAVTVHRDPGPDSYRDVRRLGDGDRIRPLIGGRDVEITALLGPAET